LPKRQNEARIISHPSKLMKITYPLSIRTQRIKVIKVIVINNKVDIILTRSGLPILTIDDYDLNFPLYQS